MIKILQIGFELVKEHDMMLWCPYIGVISFYLYSLKKTQTNQNIHTLTTGQASLI